MQVYSGLYIYQKNIIKKSEIPNWNRWSDIFLFIFTLVWINFSMLVRNSVRDSKGRFNRWKAVQWVMAITDSELMIYLCAFACRAKIWFLFCFVESEKCIDQALEEECPVGRLAPWLRSLVPASAPPPKTTAAHHFSCSAYRGESLRSRMKLLRHNPIYRAAIINPLHLYFITKILEVKVKDSFDAFLKWKIHTTKGWVSSICTSTRIQLGISVFYTSVFVQFNHRI